MIRTLTLVCFMLVLCSGGLAGSQDLPPGFWPIYTCWKRQRRLRTGSRNKQYRPLRKSKPWILSRRWCSCFFTANCWEHGTAVDDWRKGQALLKQFILNIEKDADQYVPTLKLLSAS